MLRTRVMPCLLLHQGTLVKTVRFKNPTYVGDPSNAVRIFNELEVDELIVLDISATSSGRGPALDVLSGLASECFMPIAYGGGVRSVSDARSIFSLGVEKVILNTAALERLALVNELSEEFGSQAVVVSLDVRQSWLKQKGVYAERGSKKVSADIVGLAGEMVRAGAGELLVHSIDRDGTWEGYDLETLKSVSDAVQVPVIACGGAGCLEDFRRAVEEGGASAVAAGSMVVFQKKGLGVLINFPKRAELERLLQGSVR
jgi:imidazole glycerol-phosphate synthase subunit HisF